MSPDECNVDSILSLMGATIFHFIVGIKIMWGNVTPYITSYLVQFNPDVTTHQTVSIAVHNICNLCTSYASNLNSAFSCTCTR